MINSLVNSHNTKKARFFCVPEKTEVSFFAIYNHAATMGNPSSGIIPGRDYSWLI